MSEIKLNTIEEAIEDFREGKFIIVVDDEDRENEGDFIVAAEKITPEKVNFMLTYGRGVLCAPITEERCRELELDMQVAVNTSMLETPFTVTVDKLGGGCTTGVSMSDRCATIRALADKVGLKVAHKPDSQDICFVPTGEYASFVEEYSSKKVAKGNFVTTKGEIVGQHEGIIHYTIGQRRGLGLPMGHRIFVTGIRPKTNEVVVGENKDLFSREVYADHVNFMSVPDLSDGMRVTAKIRYNHKGAAAVARMTKDGQLECVFDEPQRAAAPGQALVLYDADGNVVGGGTIINKSL